MSWRVYAQVCCPLPLVVTNKILQLRVEGVASVVVGAFPMTQPFPYPTCSVKYAIYVPAGLKDILFAAEIHHSYFSHLILASVHTFGRFLPIKVICSGVLSFIFGSNKVLSLVLRFSWDRVDMVESLRGHVYDTVFYVGFDFLSKLSHR